MRKDYYLTLGYTKQDKKELAKIISKKLDILMTPTESDYIGEGFSFLQKDSDFIESLKITNHYLEDDDWWRYEDFKNCPILVSISFTKGKNVDKMEKVIKIKELLNQIKGLIEIKSEVVESKS